MRHEIVLPFEGFEKYNLALMIIAKQREYIKSGCKDKIKEKAIRLMLKKLVENSEGLEDTILNQE